MPSLKQKEQASTWHIIFCIVAIRVLKNQSGFIYTNNNTLTTPKIPRTNTM